MLILRDFLLSKLIEKCVLNDKLFVKIKELAILTVNAYSNLCHPHSIEVINNKATYKIGDNEVDENRYRTYENDVNENRVRVRALTLDIQRSSNLVDWTIKHFKQDMKNPINQWTEDEMNRTKKYFVDTNSQ